ncbi:MAG: hypothetical protein K2X93_04625 [Candidatus Obscuribacterales bacterium]|nr:hypothetical protein [Candidatus Obscuribacterales bacterium]
MGVTIHYQGKLKSEDNLEPVLKVCRDFARINGWAFAEISQNKTLMRIVNGADCDYTGHVSGVVIQPPGLCEPFGFEFDGSMFLQDYCKTQFAGPSVHIQAIRLLREIEVYFDNFSVRDEGEFWISNDRNSLVKLMDECDQWMLEAKGKNPDYSGPIVNENGRITDLARTNVETKKPGWFSKLLKKSRL